MPHLWHLVGGEIYRLRTRPSTTTTNNNNDCTRVRGNPPSLTVVWFGCEAATARTRARARTTISSPHIHLEEYFPPRLVLASSFGPRQDQRQGQGQRQRQDYASISPTSPPAPTAADPAVYTFLGHLAHLSRTRARSRSRSWSMTRVIHSMRPSCVVMMMVVVVVVVRGVVVVVLEADKGSGI